MPAAEAVAKKILRASCTYLSAFSDFARLIAVSIAIVWVGSDLLIMIKFEATFRATIDLC